MFRLRLDKTRFLKSQICLSFSVSDMVHCGVVWHRERTYLAATYGRCMHTRIHASSRLPLNVQQAGISWKAGWPVSWAWRGAATDLSPTFQSQLVTFEFQRPLFASPPISEPHSSVDREIKFNTSLALGRHLLDLTQRRPHFHI